MNQHPPLIKSLINKLTRLPGIGPKAAERIVFYLLKQNNKFIDELSQNVNSLKSEVKLCSQCFNISTQDLCPICGDPKRDKSIICVVAEPQDVLVIEKTGEYNGLYHILGGVLNPIENITPDKLKIKELVIRIKKNGIKEIIIATNPDLEGESTSMYLARQLKPLKLKITRLAKGLPMGSTIEYADEITISSALKGRQEV
jgi:recombination protein RecR